jgi:hypothetical protein
MSLSQNRAGWREERDAAAVLWIWSKDMGTQLPHRINTQTIAPAAALLVKTHILLRIALLRIALLRIALLRIALLRIATRLFMGSNS